MCHSNSEVSRNSIFKIWIPSLFKLNGFQCQLISDRTSFKLKISINRNLNHSSSIPSLLSHQNCGSISRNHKTFTNRTPPWVSGKEGWWLIWYRCNGNKENGQPEDSFYIKPKEVDYHFTLSSSFLCLMKVNTCHAPSLETCPESFLCILSPKVFFPFPHPRNFTFYLHIHIT